MINEEPKAYEIDQSFNIKINPEGIHEILESKFKSNSMRKNKSQS